MKTSVWIRKSRKKNCISDYISPHFRRIFSRPSTWWFGISEFPFNLQERIFVGLAHPTVPTLNKSPLSGPRTICSSPTPASTRAFRIPSPTHWILHLLGRRQAVVGKFSAWRVVEDEPIGSWLFPVANPWFFIKWPVQPTDLALGDRNQGFN